MWDFRNGYFGIDVMCDNGTNVEYKVSFDKNGLFSGFVNDLGVRGFDLGWWESGEMLDFTGFVRSPCRMIWGEFEIFGVTCG